MQDIRGRVNAGVSVLADAYDDGVGECEAENATTGGDEENDIN